MAVDTEQQMLKTALEFYGPMYPRYSVYDGVEDQEAISLLLGAHGDRFIVKAGFG